MITVQQIALTPAQVYALHATPMNVLPAPLNGFVNNILGISHQMTYGGAAYTTATQIDYYTVSGSPVFKDTGVLPATGVYELPATKVNAAQTTFSTSQALMLTTDAVAATGTSVIVLTIIYETVAIS